MGCDSYSASSSGFLGAKTTKARILPKKNPKVKIPQYKSILVFLGS